MMAAPKIVLHHVGGRWGNHGFPRLPAFAGDFVEVLYEADTDAIPAIYQARKGHSGELIVIPACLADTDGEALLHIYNNPGLTSLREFGLALARRYQNQFGIDFDFGKAGARLLDKRKVSTRQLDGLIEAPDALCPTPDFLSLDTQSSEYEILLGARGVLERSICGLIVEVEFGEMYLGQKRFQEVYDLLDSAGFEFVRFLTIGETSDTAPLGFRGSGYQGQADALFLRRIDRIPRDEPRRREMLTKLCFFALVFGVVELAVQCVAALRGMTLPHGAVYERFVATFRDIYERDSKLFAPVFSAVLPAHRMADYSAAASPQQWPQILEGLRQFDDSYLRALKCYAARADDDFEALLRHHGLGVVAAVVKRTRRSEARNIRWAILSAHGRAPRLRAVLKQSAKAIRRAVLGE
jgi:FkbM family methyltransferase